MFLALAVLGTLVLTRKKMDDLIFSILCSFVVLFAIFLFLVTSSSAVIWRNIEFLRFFQFPWRLLSPATFLLSFLSGSIIYLWNGRAGGQVVLATTLILIGTFSLVNQYSPQKNTYVRLSDDTLKVEKIRLNNLPATLLHEYRPKWVKRKPVVPVDGRIVPSNPETEIIELKNTPYVLLYEINLPGDTDLTANIYYFPGWKVYVNGKETSFSVSAQGLMQFYLPQGSYEILLKFENTFIRTMANSLSLMGIIFFLIYMLLNRKLEEIGILEL
jgi:hypothetical protein